MLEAAISGERMLTGPEKAAALLLMMGKPPAARLLKQFDQPDLQAVARAAAFARRVIIMDEPTAALGVKESRRVLELIVDVKKRGLPIILISHNMPHVFEVADRIHIHRLGRRLTVIDPKKQTMSDAVAMMTGAMAPPVEAVA